MTEPAATIVGRDRELALLSAFAGAAPGARALVLAGGPGIGKTTLWETAIAVARTRGLRVLTARPSDAEAQHPFLALADLFDGVDTSALAGVPAPQLRALEVALLRAEPEGSPPEPHAIALGCLSALRSLAGAEPLVVAIDDVQWLDPASTEAIAFAARRLQDAPVSFLLARRADSPAVLERALGPTGVERLELAPLSLGATRRMLSAQLGLTLPRSALRRIFEATLGNPLFALEVGRTLAARGPLELGEEIPVPAALEDLLGTRVAALPDAARRALLAVALSADLRSSQLAAVVEPSALDDAVDAGVLVVDGDRVRPSHPLLGAAARASSRAAERRELHRALAGVIAEAHLRARHLALAAETPDAELAATVAAAASAASTRGARREAVELGEHALRLTPRDAPEWSERLVALGASLAAAGERQRVTELISPELDGLPPGRARVRAYELLAVGVVRDNDDIQRHLTAALAAAGSDPALRAGVLLEISENEAVIRVERIRAAEAWALEALPAATAAGGDVARRALYSLAWARSLTGRPIDDLCDRFHAVGPEAYPPISVWPDRVAGQRLVWRGEVDAGRALLGELLALADERGESYSYLLQRLHVCQLELRVGDWAAAERILDEWAESSEQAMWPMYERCRALLAAGRGEPEQARAWADQALVAAQATGTSWDRLEALRARGVAALLAGDPADAAASLRTVWEHARSEGVDEPGVFPTAPDLVDALLELGETEDAAGVADRLRGLAEAQAHPWALAAALLCDARIRLASGYDDDAAADLARAAAAFGDLGLRFDRARALLALGRAQRRFKKWGAARESLEAAAAAFDELASAGWAEHARSELSRVGARKPRPSGELTPSEQRVVELAASGLANKEIAQALFVTVRTVEVHLSNAYAKLGVRSRAQLASRLAGAP
jgi:DNA-binding NarL/FixJ family response regulator